MPLVPKLLAACALIICLCAPVPAFSQDQNKDGAANPDMLYLKTAPQNFGDADRQEDLELERRMKTEVEHTTIDRGDGLTTTRDSLGEGDVGLFYDYKQDERIKDDDHSIGIEFRLLEFE